jgi:LacI family transcriptional regulator, galactose operon repressor
MASKKNQVPKYFLLKEKIKREIRNKDLLPGHKIQSISMMVSETGLSKNTVIRALSDLVKDGWLYTFKGKGIFVAETSEEKSLHVGLADRNIGFVYGNTGKLRPAHGEILHAIERIGQEKYAANISYISMGLSGVKPSKENILSVLSNRGFTGLILTGILPPVVIKVVKELGIPYVLTDHIASTAPTRNETLIATDSFLEGYYATKYLLDLGHEQIALLVEPINYYWSQSWVRGFRVAHESAGKECPEQHIIECSNETFESGVEGAKKLLSAGPTPTAVVTCTDIYAAALIPQLRQKGLRVPEDVSIISISSTEMAISYDPPLTTIGSDVEDVARTAMDELMRLVEGDMRWEGKIHVPIRLVERSSCLKLNKNRVNFEPQEIILEKG